MMKQSKRLLSILLTLVLLFGMLPTAAFAEEIIDKDKISSVAITLDRPVAGEPLANCVPETTLCDITCTWSNGSREVSASTLAEAGKTYYLAMVLTPTLPFYTFADSVTGTVNGTSVTVERVSNTQVACMVRLTPVTRETEVAVSLPQPVINTTPGTPTVAGGHTVWNTHGTKAPPTILLLRPSLPV